jgi:phosphoribosylaminoimidazole carboxylase (NCAIR synthetase)
MRMCEASQVGRCPQPKLLSPAVMVNVLGQHVMPTRALIGRASRMVPARLRQGGNQAQP